MRRNVWFNNCNNLINQQTIQCGTEQCAPTFHPLLHGTFISPIAIYWAGSVLLLKTNLILFKRKITNIFSVNKKCSSHLSFVHLYIAKMSRCERIPNPESRNICNADTERCELHHTLFFCTKLSTFCAPWPRGFVDWPLHMQIRICVHQVN